MAISRVARRSRGGDPQHVALGVAQIGKIYRHRLRPTEQNAAAAEELAYDQQRQWQRDRADRVDVAQRIQADAPRGISGEIAEMLGDVAMRRFVHRDRKDDGQRINRDGLKNIEFHD